MSDETEIQAAAARDGDADAFAALYERVAPALHAWAQLRVRGRLLRTTDPEDVLQEVWWNALQSFPTFDSAKGSFRGWLFAIATRVFIASMRRNFVRDPDGEAKQRSGTLPPDLQASLTSITRNAARNEGTEALVRAVHDLPRDDQKLFVHCGLEGMTAKDAAPILSMSAEAVKKRWQRLRDKLRVMPGWATLFDVV